MRGRFITLEGGEGTGKSTQARRLAEWLRGRGLEVVVTREPGGSAGAEILRHVLLSGAAKPLGVFAEALLFTAARADHVASLIRPALERGAWVISDRFMDSTRAYQGAAGNMEASVVDRLERVAVDGVRPDLTLMLDVPVEVALHRADVRRAEGTTDRFEAEDIGFHQRLRQAFRDIATADPSRCVIIDASTDADSVAARIVDVVEERFQFGAGKAALP